MALAALLYTGRSHGSRLILISTAKMRRRCRGKSSLCGVIMCLRDFSATRQGGTYRNGHQASQGALGEVLQGAYLDRVVDGRVLNES